VKAFMASTIILIEVKREKKDMKEYSFLLFLSYPYSLAAYRVLINSDTFHRTPYAAAPCITFLCTTHGLHMSATYMLYVAM
jgi:hypothetical protein